MLLALEIAFGNSERTSSFAAIGLEICNEGREHQLHINATTLLESIVIIPQAAPRSPRNHIGYNVLGSGLIQMWS